MSARKTPARKAAAKKAAAKRAATKKAVATKRARGRPSKYDPKTSPVIAAGLARGGATDIEIADALEIASSTFYAWQAAHPEFAEALTLGKTAPDERVVRSLYRRAVGYSFDTVKIFKPAGEDPTIVPYREHVPPDTTAAIFWLKNRRREDWRDKVEHEHETGPVLSELLQKRRARARQARDDG